MAPSSWGTVSSMRRTAVFDREKMTMSGRWVNVVTAISRGKQAESCLCKRQKETPNHRSWRAVLLKLTWDDDCGGLTSELDNDSLVIEWVVNLAGTRLKLYYTKRGSACLLCVRYARWERKRERERERERDVNSKEQVNYRNWNKRCMLCKKILFSRENGSVGRPETWNIFGVALLLYYYFN